MNLYPMKTVADGQIVRNCRLVAEHRSTTLWRWDSDAGTAVVLRRISTIPTRVGATERWEVDDLLVEPQRGCGCQHPMYTFVPPEDLEP